MLRLLKKAFVIFVLFLLINNIHASNNEQFKLNDGSLLCKDKVNVIFSCNEGETFIKNVNVIKVKFNYDSNIFENLTKSNFEACGNWSDIKYNEDTNELIIVNLYDVSTSKIFKVNLKVKENVCINKYTNLYVSNISYSYRNSGEDINLKYETYCKVLVNQSLNETIVNELKNENIDLTNQEKNSYLKNPITFNKIIFSEFSKYLRLNDEKEENVINEDSVEENIVNNIENKCDVKKEKISNNRINYKVIISILGLLIGLVLIAILIKLKLLNKSFMLIFFIVSFYYFISLRYVFAYELKGDINFDGTVNLIDVNLLEEVLIDINTIDYDLKNTDFNNDGKTTLGDLSLLIKNIGKNVNNPEDDIKFETKSIGIGGCGCTNTPTISPFDSNTMITLTDMGGFFISYNAGENWERRNLIGRNYCVCFDKNREGVIYVGGSGLYRSEDNGKTFEILFPSKSSILTSMNRFEYGINYIYSNDSYDTYKLVYSVVVNPYDSNNIFVLQYSYKEGIIYESVDNGKNFNKIVKFKKKDDNSYNEMFCKKDSLIFVNNDGVYKYNFSNKTVESLYVTDTKIIDMDIVENNYIMIENVNFNYEKYDKVKTKLVITEDFKEFRDLTQNVIDDINDEAKKMGIDDIDFKCNFSHLMATSINDICLTNQNYEYEGDYKNYISGVIKLKNGKFYFLYGHPFVNIDNLENRGWGWNDANYKIYGVTIDQNNYDKVLFTTLCGIYYYDNGKIYQRYTNINLDDLKNKTYTSNGMDMQTTYGIRKDPFNSNHLLMLNTDLGLISSYDGGESWIQSNNGINENWLNTVYDLEFDKSKENVVYSIWSSRHDAPYTTYDDEITGRYGGFAISYDGGKSWKCDYSNGLPEYITPTKISVIYKGENEERIIYLTSFNAGCYVSYDSGKNFEEINSGIDKIKYYDENGRIKHEYIFGVDIEASGDKVFLLTAMSTINNNEKRGKVYELINNTWSEIYINDSVKCPRDIYYYNGVLYISATASFYYDYNVKDVNYKLLGGGIYSYDGSGVSQLYKEDSSITGIKIDSQNNIYISDIYGNIYLKNSKDDFKKIYSNYHFVSKGLDLYDNYLYLSTFGGGMLRLKIIKN